MADDFIDYGQLIDDAMHVIVKHTLQKVAKEGLPGKHHFFISFLTQFSGVILSEKLRAKYPEEMTVVLQYQFEDLDVQDHSFSVVLSFDNVKEKILIPFSALTAFADPSVKFGLQFRHLEAEEEDGVEEHFHESPASKPVASEASAVSGKKRGAKEGSNSNVVKLDAFRKAHPKKKK